MGVGVCGRGGDRIGGSCMNWQFGSGANQFGCCHANWFRYSRSNQKFCACLSMEAAAGKGQLGRKDRLKGGSRFCLGASRGGPDRETCRLSLGRVRSAVGKNSLWRRLSGPEVVCAAVAASRAASQVLISFAGGSIVKPLELSGLLPAASA